MNVPPSPQCSVPARYARLHYALGGGGKETKTTTNILPKVPNSFQDLTPVPAPRPEFSWFFPARAYPLLRQMAVESKPLFHPEVLRQQVRSFFLPEQTAAWQPKLEHWAELIRSGRADQFKESELLPDFLTDFFCGLLGYTGPAEGADTYTVSRERHVEV